MVSEVDVLFLLGRVYLGHSCLWCVFGDRLGLGSHVIGRYMSSSVISVEYFCA